MKPHLLLLALGIILVAAVIPSLAAANPHPPKPPKDVGSLTAMARHYVRVEHHIAAAANAVPTPELIAHWEELHALRVGLTRLDRRGDLKKLKEGRRLSVRHVLAQMLGEDNDVSLDGDSRLERAHSRRTEDLFAISTVARRAFDIATADVNGTWNPG